MKLKSIITTMLFSLIGLTAFADDTDISSLENAVYIASGTTINIDANGEAVIPINMKNSVGTTGYQFNVKLPDGIYKSDITFKKSSVRKSEDVSFSGAYQADGTYKIVAYTSDDNEFSGNDGEIANIIVANATAGNYTFTISGGSITSHGASYKIDGDIVSTVTVKENSYEEGYAVTIAPFSVDVNQEYDEDIENTNDNKVVVFKMKNSSEVSKIEFDVELAEGISIGQYRTGSGSKKDPYVYHDDLYFAGDYESEEDFPEVDDNEDGSKHFTAENDFKITDNCADIIKIAITTEELASGVYPISINNIVATLADGKTIDNIAPYSTEIYVGETTAVSPTNGVVTFSGDYSDEDMAAKMLSAIPTDDATVATVDLSGVTALPAGKEITTANPNALIMTSTDLGLVNTNNVVIGKTCENLVLTDKNDFVTDKKFTATNASYTREMSNKWGTICLPYAVESNEQVAYYNITGVENGVLTLEKYDILPANTPALAQKASGNAIVCEANSVKVGGLISDVTGNVTMKGSFANNTKVTDENAYYIANNKFWLNNQYFYVDAFRAYFTVSTSGAKASVFSIDETATEIEALTGGNDVIGIWDANGMARENAGKGMNIMKMSNGRTVKVFIK